MENINITQEHIDKYVATTEDFWKEFHQSLSAPFSIWNEFKERSEKEWINMCRNSEEMIPYLNFLFQYPVLKGEYLIAYYSGIVLTNYRLLIKDDNAGVPNIPLNKLIEYTDGGDIKYEKNGQTLELDYSDFMDDNIVNSAKSRNETKNLSQEQLFILENSMYELNKHNSELKIPTIQIPDEQDTSINLKETIENFTQGQADKYIANTESFWKDFHKSLGNSFSLWNQHKDETFDKWVSMCWNTKEMINNFNILFQYPLLKGEYPIAYATGMILTNYRLLINDQSNNIPSIPLTKIKKYSLQEGGIIEIENQTEKLRYNEMLKEEFVTSAISRCKKDGLDETQEKLITNSLTDLNKDFSAVSIPKTEMYPLTEEQKVEKQKFEKAEKRGNAIGKVIGAIIVIALIVGAIAIFGGGSGKTHTCQQCGTEFTGAGYAGAFGVCNKDNTENETMSLYCSCKCCTAAYPGRVCNEK